MTPLFVNGRFLSQPLSGMQRYARCLLAAYDQLRSEHGGMRDVVVLVPADAVDVPVYQTLAVREVGTLRGHGWDQVELARASRGGTLVSLTAAGPLLHPDQILVLHDAAIFAHPRQFTLAYRTLHRILRPRLAQRARRLITVSEFSRHELAHHLGMRADRFAIVPNGADHLLAVTPDLSILTRTGLRAGRYVLVVGNHSANKQIALAEAAFEMACLPGYDLVHVGGAVPHVLAGAEAGLTTRALGRVDDAGLAALYASAHALIFPSRYEGFGIPPLEAMSLGCPVVASRAAALPEILGVAPLYANPGDVAGFANGLRSLADPAVRERAIKEGRMRAARFTWRSSASWLAEIVEPAATFERADVA